MIIRNTFVALSAATFLAGTAFAVSFNNNAVWDASAAINTGTPGDTYKLFDGSSAVIDYEAERDVKDQRPLMQTFQLKSAASLSVTDIFFQYNGANGLVDTIDLIVYKLDDVFAFGTPADDDIATNPPVGGTEIWKQSVTLNGVKDSDLSNNYTMQISGLSGLTLQSTTGVEGYGLMMFNPDKDGGFPFKWAIERTEGKIPSVGDGSLGPYPFGRPYSDNEGSAQEEHEFSLALAGNAAATTVSDTGATLAMLGLGIAGVFVVRRRFAK